MADYGTMYELPGCTGNLAALRRSESSEDARAGNLVQVEMDRGQADGATPIIFWSLAPAVPSSFCGIPHPVGEVMIQLSPLLAKSTSLTPWTSGAPTTFDIPIPADPAIVDLTVWCQRVFVDTLGTSAEPFRLTNGFYMEIGAP